MIGGGGGGGGGWKQTRDSQKIRVGLFYCIVYFFYGSQVRSVNQYVWGPPGWQPEGLQGVRAEAQRYLTSPPPPSHDTALGTWSSSARASALEVTRLRKEYK